MATTPRPWPNNALHQRDSAAEELQCIITSLTPIIQNNRKMTYDEVLARIARAMLAAQNAIRWLEQAGAPTQPIE